MTDLGMGAILGRLGGNEETVKGIQSSLGKVIVAVEINPELNGAAGALILTFKDRRKLMVYDSARNCCECRYMMTDDNLADFVGTTLTTMEVQEAPNLHDEYGEAHEQQFLIVTTSKGRFTCVTHNEHNGYYGGFWIEARIIEPEPGEYPHAPMLGGPSETSGQEPSLGGRSD